MSLVGMGTDDKSVFAFGEPHGKLVPDPVGFLGIDLAGLEALPDVIGDDVLLTLIPSMLMSSKKSTILSK